jgi:phosphotransferase system HPr (HPr) family protein
MTTLSVTVNNGSGLHARPAASFSQFCNTFSNTITLIHEGIEINPKSIIMLMSSGIRQGALLEIRVDGENHQDICMTIVDYIKNLQD